MLMQAMAGCVGYRPFILGVGRSFEENLVDGGHAWEGAGCDLAEDFSSVEEDFECACLVNECAESH